MTTTCIRSRRCAVSMVTHSGCITLHIVVTTRTSSVRAYSTNYCGIGMVSIVSVTALHCSVTVSSIFAYDGEHTSEYAFCSGEREGVRLNGGSSCIGICYRAGDR